MSPAKTILTCTLMCAAGAAQADERVTMSLDGDWAFTWTGPSVEAIPAIPPSSAFDVTAKVPGGWDDQLDRFKAARWFKTARFTTTLGPVRYLTGIGWYRKIVDAPAAWKGRAVRLTIGWAVGQTHVWLNGKHVGTYDYGVYTPYAIDLTNHIRPGQKNELTVSVDNTRGFAGGWAFLGNAGKASGITRSVTLEVSGGPGRIDDLYVRPGDDLHQVVWQIDLGVPGGPRRAPDSRLVWRVRDAAKRAVLAEGTVKVPAFDRSRQITWKARVDGIRPWSPRQPNLYWTDIRWVAGDGVVWDAHAQRFGLRRWTHEGRKLKLNGRTVYLRGDFGAYYYAVHCTTPTSKAHWTRYIRRAKQIGMNYINFAARVCPIELLEAADEVGMIMQCGDHMTVLKEHREHYKDVWTPILRWTRRHPSMCFYGFGGERNYYEGIIEQYQKQYNLIKSLYPESMVMPQQAIRGIDYAFDEKGKRELTRRPFPHHAERLARYTKACDLFGHYSGGAFGYSYFSTPWQEMEKRFRIYDKPLSMHELFMGASYLNPDNVGKYTGRVPPYLYTTLREDLTEAGLLDRWPTYHLSSSKLHAICKKYCVEKTRKCDGLAGFEFLGMQDMHFTPHYTTGILDEFGQLKPGDTVEGILRYNNESVLLLDFAGGSINRSYCTGAPFEAQIMVSLYADAPIRNGRLSWALKDGDRTALQDSCVIPSIPNGGVSTIRTLKISWPAVERTTRFNLSVKLKGNACDLANDWDFWVFPKLTPPKVAADADDNARRRLAGRYNGLGKLAKGSKTHLRIVSRIAARDVEHLAAGGDVLLLGAAPFNEYTSWRSFRPGLGAREHHNVGSVIAQHPIFADLPHEGWGDWPFYPVLEGASCVYFEDDLGTPFDPILEIISSAEDVRKHAAIFEKRVGKGRLMVSTCMFDADNPSGVALMDGILRYTLSDRFKPSSTLSPTVLTRLTLPVDPADPRNLVAAPSFERQSEVRRCWLKYGTDYEIDATTAHSGHKSLKIGISPDAIKNNPCVYVGARAKAIRFKRSPRVLKVSAWHKTQGLTGAKGNSFLIFIYLTYKEGGRHTLRLHFNPSTHDWQLAETTWKPAKPVAAATLYIGLAHQSGTAWIDDVYFGEAPTGPAPTPARTGPVWHREPVTIDFKTAGWFRVNDGKWTSGQRVRVTQEGVTRVAFKAKQDDPAPKTREVRIDVTPPVIALSTRPAMSQEGGVYFATPETDFAFEATDKLSGVKGVEVSIDGKAYTPYASPLRLAQGRHEIRCRATDAAGNRTDSITGSILTGGKTDVLVVNIR